MTTLAQHVAGLTITQGVGAGQPLQVFPWERRFLRLIERTDGDLALSMARGNGKSAFCAAIADAAYRGPLAVPRGEVVVVASSFTQAGIIFDHARGFLGNDYDKSRYRVLDSTSKRLMEDRETGARLRCIGCDPRRAHGLAPVLVLMDEPAQYLPSLSARMLAALETSLGKVPGSRLIVLGTRPDDDGHWFEKRLQDGGGVCYAARDDDPPFQRRTWKRANPSLDFMPNLEAQIRKEAKRARHDADALAAFRALRLNLGTADEHRQELLPVAVYREAERPIGERSGHYVLGVDLGQNAAMSAAAGYWPETRTLDAFACFPERPGLGERGLQDGVGSLYRNMRQRGELIQAGGRVSDIPALLDHVVDRWGPPSAIVTDRWREAELRQHLERGVVPACPLVTRGQGYKDGGEDVREFRAAFLAGDVRPVESLLLRAAMKEARTVSDPAGNAKLAKQTEGGRRAAARDDAAAAAILAVAEGRRRHRAAPEAEGASAVVV